MSAEDSRPPGAADDSGRTATDATRPESAPNDGGASAGESSSGLFRPQARRSPRHAALPPEFARLEPGSTIGEFRLLLPLGQGGMGSVWAAEQPSVGHRRVALKVIREDRISERTIRYFQREADTGGTISHPGIVAVFASGEADGVHYIAQELIGDGHTLADWIADLRTQETALAEADYREIAEFAAEVAEAVQAAHAAGVIHRDLKPQNILVDPEGNPKVTDFGLAKKLGEESLSGRLDLIGTYYYMSPEQAMAKAIGLDHRTDIFSLGVVFYEMLTQRRPFDGDTREEILGQVSEEDPPPPHRVKSKTPPDLSWICVKAMEKRRDDRYQSMADFAADLRRWLAHQPIVARDPGPIRRAQKWVRRHPTTSTAGGILLTGFAVVLGLLAVISGKKAELEETNSELELSQADALKSADLAEERREEAEASARLAEQREEEAKEALAGYTRLADLEVLEELQEEEEQLWPARPHLIESMERWIGQAESLLERLPGHERDLAALREECAPVSNEMLSEALSRSPRRREYEDASLELAEVTARLIDLPDMVDADPDSEQGSNDDGDRTRGVEEETRLVGRRDGLLALRAEIEQAARATVQWRFPGDPEQQWRHDNLAALVEGAHALAAAETGLLASVKERVDSASTMEERTLGDHFDAWLDAADGIASSEHYDGLELSELVGLVPIGPDRSSGLWEFWHVESGARPERHPESGGIAVSEDMGIVLVLIPGATFWMGASVDPAEPNHDPGAQRDEGPVREVTLAPYLLSKYELTQGQWFRLTGDRPSQYAAGSEICGRKIFDSNPVTNVSWDDGQRVLPRFGLRHPTEAQWEWACRAGATTPWWTGDLASIASEEGVAGNLFDEGSLARGAPASWGAFESWDDGHVCHAPVGTFRTNRHGLYDVLGNVWEWCEDGYVENAYQLPADARDGHRRVFLNPTDVLSSRVNRGGSFVNTAARARSANRDYSLPSFRSIAMGLRPAMAIEP